MNYYIQVVSAAQGRVPVFLDGGVRRGTDVFKALALGASGVFVSINSKHLRSSYTEFFHCYTSLFIYKYYILKLFNLL